MAEVFDPKKRNFGIDGKGRGLQASIPKPNIVRIELLDGNARDRYLGHLQRGADGLLKKKIYQHIANNKDDVFFGFLRNIAKQSYGLSANWDKAATGGGVLGAAKALVDKTGKAIPILGAGINVVQGASDLVSELTGINAKVTGSSSLKRYNGGGLTNNFSVDCGWYLPEQSLLCIRSLRILHKMIYPIKVEDASLTEGLSALVGKKIEDLAALTGDGTIANTMNLAAKTVKSIGPEAIQLLITANRFFGRELTFDPLPIRLCIGQYMDIEPLVITSMKFDFSKETYINKEGRHVPITCSVTIQFKFWMNPSPDLEFVSLLGHEMFGYTQDTQAILPITPPPSVTPTPSFNNTGDPSLPYDGPTAFASTTNVSLPPPPQTPTGQNLEGAALLAAQERIFGTSKD